MKVFLTISERYECPHCHKVILNGGKVCVVNHNTTSERRFCSSKCAWDGRPTFTISICKIYWLTPCADYRAEHARGLIGFHNTDKCPSCLKEEGGFELWGENHHCQGRVSSYPDADYIAKYDTFGSPTRSLRSVFVDGPSYTYLR